MDHSMPNAGTNRGNIAARNINSSETGACKTCQVVCMSLAICDIAAAARGHTPSNCSKQSHTKQLQQAVTYQATAASSHIPSNHGKQSHNKAAAAVMHQATAASSHTPSGCSMSKHSHTKQLQQAVTHQATAASSHTPSSCSKQSHKLNTINSSGTYVGSCSKQSHTKQLQQAATHQATAASSHTNLIPSTVLEHLWVKISHQLPAPWATNPSNSVHSGQFRQMSVKQKSEEEILKLSYQFRTQLFICLILILN